MTRKRSRMICAVLAFGICMSAVMPVYADQKTAAVNKEIVFVDGNMDAAYADSGKITVDTIVKQNGDSNTTGDIYILYDNTNIYIYGDIKDSSRTITQPEQAWTTDSVEIQLDLDCYDTSHAIGSGYTGLFRVVRYTGSVEIAEKSTSPAFLAVASGIQCAVVDKSEDGYTFEAAISHGNNFRGAKLGVSCLINDAADNVKGLKAMIFMNSTNKGGYFGTGDLYKFTLNNFSNARASDASAYITDSSSSNVSSTASGDATSENTSTVDTSSQATTGGSSDITIPKDNNGGGLNPIFLYAGIGTAAVAVILVIIIVSVKKNRKKKSQSAESKDKNRDENQ